VRAAAGLPAGTSVAPHCPRPGGLLRLHLIAAARLALPLGVRVEVRHDLIGVRLAQVALGFGADTLAGPQDSGRHLPLAAIPRPSETSQAALCELVRQAGLEATTHAPERTQR
jgi:2-iminoacetate synthase ThiH